MVWPKRLDMGQERLFTFEHLHEQKKRFESDPERFTRFHADSEWLCGYAIPPFQRPVVWDEERMVRLVESAILGMHIGTWTYNDTSGFSHPAGPSGEELLFADRWLLDGRQRLTALDRYWDDAFPVYGLCWSEVPESDRRRFLSQVFPSYCTKSLDEDYLRDLYDRLNFGGVPHEPHQRATRVP